MFSRQFFGSDLGSKTSEFRHFERPKAVKMEDSPRKHFEEIYTMGNNRDKHSLVSTQFGKDREIRV